MNDRIKKAQKYAIKLRFSNLLKINQYLFNLYIIKNTKMLKIYIYII